MKNDEVMARKSGSTLIGCPECDLLVHTTDAAEYLHYSALCPRCGALLCRRSRNGVENTLALACAALVLWVIANSFPVIGLNIQGQRIDTNVVGAALQLWREGMPIMSSLVVVTTALMPLLEILALIWLTLPLVAGRRAPGFARVFRVLLTVHPWAMVEVFILGVLVALVKLAHLADVLPGPAMLGFALLMLVLTTVSSIIDPNDLWQAWEKAQE